MGRRTKQHNPAASGAQTLSQWMAAVMSMKGESDQMPVDVAVEMIHSNATGGQDPLCKEIWRLMLEHGTAEKCSDGDVSDLL